MVNKDSQCRLLPDGPIARVTCAAPQLHCMRHCRLRERDSCPLEAVLQYFGRPRCNLQFAAVGTPAAARLLQKLHAGQSVPQVASGPERGPLQHRQLHQARVQSQQVLEALHLGCLRRPFGRPVPSQAARPAPHTQTSNTNCAPPNFKNVSKTPITSHNNPPIRSHVVAMTCKHHDRLSGVQSPPKVHFIMPAQCTVLRSANTIPLPSPAPPHSAPRQFALAT